ncbi:unnamed protein product [Caenorhabditis bovis]|uniref:Thioredoxin domain-containing protein n=1 Tax=Caenorhabditis bovis TaxID=2654633 RepID=A0A8S1FAQ6_9PELO|nr:unnamed protein product [Caenorhabditis bovis]
MDSNEDSKYIEFLQQFIDFEFETDKKKKAKNRRVTYRGITIEIHDTFKRDIVIIAVLAVCTMFLVISLIHMFQLYFPVGTVVQRQGAAIPFFPETFNGMIEDHYDGTLPKHRLDRNKIVMYYSPHSISSKIFREKFVKVAQSAIKLHKHTYPAFAAVNCFDPKGACRNQFKMPRFPIITATSPQFVNSVYNGPMKIDYVSRWVNRIQNPVIRISNLEDLIRLTNQFDLLVVSYLHPQKDPNFRIHFRNYTAAAYSVYDGTPNTEALIFCIVTDMQMANVFRFNKYSDIVMVNSDAQVISSSVNQNWTIEQIVWKVKENVILSTRKSVEILNVGFREHSSTQFADRVNRTSTILLMAPDLRHGNEKFETFRKLALQYHYCKEKNIQEIERVEENTDDFGHDCPVSIKSYSCNRNSTLRFLAIDTLVNPQLATKFGGEKEDVLITINAQNEMTKMIKGKITTEKIRCLIQQHHEAADNEFVVESARILPNIAPRSVLDMKKKSIGEPNLIPFVANVAELLESPKISVALFSAGVSHAPSQVVLAPFHLASRHFATVTDQIQFVIVDVSLNYVPYNFNFEKLPKILILGDKKTGSSWMYPEGLPITYPNLLRFIETRPSTRTLIAAVEEQEYLTNLITSHMPVDKSKVDRLKNLDYVIQTLQNLPSDR